MSAPHLSEKEIFLAALEYRSETECGQFLRDACGSDGRLLHSVQSLLRHHRSPDDSQTGRILSAAAREGMVRPPAVATYRPGMRIGRYRLLEEIGEGGCGIVLLALQEEPVRREVALKVTKPGMDTRAIIARFEAERQTLALMNHPGIARVLDAGATDAGHPYFVMERVLGDRLTRHCEEHRVGTRERLELMIQVCRAVEHAHQKGIIHRDLKPSNILVTLEDGRAVPKVIDFGIAKAIQTNGAASDLTAQEGGFVGTPDYMSPEQLSPQHCDVDTRTDLYSLGVILFELLTGHPPSRTGSPDGGWPVDRRVVRPSTALSAQPPGELEARAGRQRTDARGLLRQVRGDLDIIVLKLLEPDRERRYATAGDLARDLRHCLDHEPISARPDGGFYWAWKFVRRHRPAVAFTAVLILVMAGGSVLLGWQYLEKGLALSRAEVAERQERMQRVRLQKSAAEERRLREAAMIQSVQAHQQAYAADMNLAQQALAGHNLGRARALLDRHRPTTGGHDLRHWEWHFLWRQCQSGALFTLCRLTNEVTTLAVSTNGRWALAGDRAGGFSVWDLATRSPVARFPKESGDSRTLAAFSPQGSLLARNLSGVEPRGTVRNGIGLWDASTATDVRFLSTEAPVTRLWFSSTGDELLSADRDGTLSRWEVSTGRRLGHSTIVQERPFPGAMDASGDLSLLAVGGAGGRVRVVETATGIERFSGQLRSDNVRALRFSPDGQSLAMSGGILDSEVSVWSISTGRESGHLSGHGAWISSIVYWPDGTALATASADQTVRLWDAKTFQSLGVLRGHLLEVWSLAISGDQQTLLSGSKDGTVNVWNPARPSRVEDLTLLEDRVRAWRFASDPGVVITLSDNGSVRRQSLAHTEIVPLAIQTEPNLSEAVFSPDGTGMAALDSSRDLALWRISDAGAQRIPHRIPGPAIPVTFTSGSDRLITWHPDSQRFRLSSREAGDLISEWPGSLRRSPANFGSMALAGDVFVTMGPDGAGELRNLTTGIRHSLDLREHRVTGIALSADGRRLAGFSSSGITHLWDTESLSPVGELRGFLLGAHGAAFSPDGSRVAVSSSGREAIKLFDATGDGHPQLLTLEVPGEILRSPAFSPDGQWLGAVGNGGKLILWNAAGPPSTNTPPMRVP